jgi:hypothetical protein
MIPVGDERGTSDVSSHFDANEGYGLVSEKAEDGRHDYGPEMRHRFGMDEAGHCFITCNKRA